VLLVAGAVAVVSAGLLVVGREYTPPESARPAAAAAGPAAAASGNAFELSIFDQPRPVADTWFQDDEGHNVALAGFRGRVILLNIWATWCVPCRQEMPALDRLQARLGGEDFRVIALSIDRKGVEAVKGFYREVGVEKLAIYVDPSGRVSRRLAIPGVPTTLLIDREGREVARKMGAAEWDGREMVSLIERTMRARPAGGAGEPR
jgi:thiol-disulfide isomerase/thioredoxin